ncbi:hypothetical protein FNV64_02075 [Streptomyces sp. S1A1-7]|nr:hypothetical protein FNV64_02075 [Streptomyces sp. S1A1-7]QDN93345.1 hypothetical protein FNV61_55480 [Streptomyces sp. RLB3-6]
MCRWPGPLRSVVRPGPTRSAGPADGRRAQWAARARHTTSWSLSEDCGITPRQRPARRHRPCSARPIGDEEARLAYVAVTRTCRRLDRRGLTWINQHPDGCGEPGAFARDPGHLKE